MISIEEIELFDGNEYREIKKEYKIHSKDDGQLIKSKKRVQRHGEVFTPKWMVKKMLSVPEIQVKLNDLHATFLEPSAGEGAFLKEILHQKLNYVSQISKKKDWQINALWALMSIYGIEYLEDNLVKARQAMTDVLINHYQAFFQKEINANSDFYKSAKLILKLNLVQGDTLKYVDKYNELITFNEWKVISEDKVLRKKFTYQSLFDEENEELNLFEIEKIDLFGEGIKENYKVVKVTKIYNEELE